MTEILIGDWECTFQELLPVLNNERNRTAEERVTLAEYFETSLEFRSTLDTDLTLNKINTSMWMIEILVDWRSRKPKTATLGALAEKIARLPGWEQLEFSLRQLITQKAKSWYDLDSDSQSKILNSKVKFQGNEFQLKKLKVLMTDQFDNFLEKHINQNVIKLVMQGSTLQMEDMRNGFLSEESFDEYQNKHEIKYCSDQVLGEGSGNTQVYKGTFGEIPVAVKIISNYNKHREAENEIKILVECKGHPNIVIYHASEIKSNMYLLAIELCHKKTLSDWIKDPCCLHPGQIKGLEILSQTTDGLGFLHENQIIHRDLKPSNILFSVLHNHVFVKIADFGISRLLPPGKQSKTVTSFGGSNGSTAAEMLEARQFYTKTGSWNSPGAPKLVSFSTFANICGNESKKASSVTCWPLAIFFVNAMRSVETPTTFGLKCMQNATLKFKKLFWFSGKKKRPTSYRWTKKMDIFSLGCIFYKVLTNGKHPFGSDETLLDYNIQQGKIQTEENSSCLRLRCNLSLVHKMIDKNPEQRPDIDYIRAHPIFWSYQKIIDYIQGISNFVETRTCRINELVEKFEENYFPKISSTDFKEQGWLIKIEDERFINHTVFKSRFEKCKYSAIKLVRLIRNFSNHFHEEQNAELKSFVGDMPEDFMKYWLNCFPTLINEMRDSFVDLRDYSSVRQYYTISEER